MDDRRRGPSRAEGQNPMTLFGRLMLVLPLTAGVACCTPAQVDRGELEIRPARSGQVAQAIQGGTLEQTHSNVVAILVDDGTGIAVCTGSLIGPNLVLTAHHCVANFHTTSCSASSFGALYGPAAFMVTTSATAASSYFNNGSWPTADNRFWFGVSQVWVPGNNFCGQDLSLLELSSSIPNICPVIPRVDEPVVDGEVYTAVGFGVTSPTGQAAGKRYLAGNLGVLCAGNCAADESPTKEWEGGTTAARGACEGDSGGPALDDQGRVIGTVSRGPVGACNETVYESITASAAWLKQHAQTAASHGNYAVAGWVTGASTAGPGGGYCPPDAGTGTGGGGGNEGTDAGADIDGGAGSAEQGNPSRVSGESLGCACQGAASGFPGGWLALIGLGLIAGRGRLRGQVAPGAAGR